LERNFNCCSSDQIHTAFKLGRSLGNGINFLGSLLFWLLTRLY